MDILRPRSFRVKKNIYIKMFSRKAYASELNCAGKRILIIPILSSVTNFYRINNTGEEGNIALIFILLNNFVNNRYFISKFERLYSSKYYLIDSRIKVMEYLLLRT
jgi:hypothetical protein